MRHLLNSVIISYLTLPFLLLAWQAWQSQWQFPQLGGQGLSWTQFEQVWTQAQLGQALLPSLWLSSSVAATAAALGLFLGRKLRQQPRAVAGAYALYAFSPLILGFLLQIHMLRLGLAGSFWAIFIGQLLYLSPYASILMYGFWSWETEQMCLQAQNLGAKGRRLWLGLLWPLAKPSLRMAFIHCFLISWMDFGLSQALGLGHYPTLGLKTFQLMQSGNAQAAALAALLLLGPALLLLPGLWVDSAWSKPKNKEL